MSAMDIPGLMPVPPSAEHNVVYPNTKGQLCVPVCPVTPGAPKDIRWKIRTLADYPVVPSAECLEEKDIEQDAVRGYVAEQEIDGRLQYVLITDPTKHQIPHKLCILHIFVDDWSPKVFYVSEAWSTHE